MYISLCVLFSVLRVLVWDADSVDDHESRFAGLLAFLAEPTWHCQGRTALHVAALNCHANVVKDLLAARAVQAVDCHGESLKSHTNTCQEALLETRRRDVNVRVKLHNSGAQGGL